MSRIGRVRAETVAAARSFLRRRTAVFFTFLFPALIILIFGALIRTDAGGGLFAEPPGWYVPGYLAVVVLFTPLSRVGSEVARHREGAQFEKLATTPLTRVEWLAGQTLVNVGVIGAAAALLVALVVLVTGATVRLSPLVVPFIVLAVALFCGLGAVLGRLADSRDGVIAASNGVAFPLLFLSEAFVPASMLPDWLPLWLSPLTYFARGVRAVTFVPPGTVSTFRGPAALGPAGNLAVLAALAVVVFAAGAAAIPRTD